MSTNPQPQGKPQPQDANTPSDVNRGPKARNDQQSQHGSNGQQQSQNRADLAQHGTPIHERSRNVDRGQSGKK